MMVNTFNPDPVCTFEELTGDVRMFNLFAFSEARQKRESFGMGGFYSKAVAIKYLEAFCDDLQQIHGATQRFTNFEAVQQ